MKQIEFKCRSCKEEFSITPYFSAPYITVGNSFYDNTRYYTASVDATAICPSCGTCSTQQFKSEVCAEDIINIATRIKNE